jgi:hypothetical protein
MRFFRSSGRRAKVLTASVGLFAAAGLAAACAPPSNGVVPGHGINEFGMTSSFFNGGTVNFNYTFGYYCDRTIPAASSSGCEVGANYVKPPQPDFDPLYITVPLGFNQPMSMEECPATLICVDHPGTLDMTRIESALKPLYPKLTNAQLTDALKNFATPGHDHFITTTNQGVPEWWDVKVIGVTSQTVFNQIRAHKSLAYIQQLQAAHNPNVTAAIPTNLFLYFGVN